MFKQSFKYSFKHLFAVVITVLFSLAHADTIPLFAAAGVKAPAEEIIAAFELRTGHKVVRLYDTAGLAEECFVAAGRQGVLITTDVRIDKAASSKVLTGGNIRRVGDTLAALAKSKAFEAKSVATGNDLKAVLLAAKSIAFSDPARGATVGVHFAQVIDRLGIKAEVMAKAKIAKDGIETMRLVASGAADIGVTQQSEIVQADRSLLLGAFPPVFELATRYNSWVAGDASAVVQDLARAFESAEGRAALQKHGLRLPL